MKKILVLCLLLMLSLQALAVADEITFRGIPWGSSLTEVEEYFSNLSIVDFDSEDVKRDTILNDDYDVYSNNSYECCWHDFVFPHGSITVAGYDVNIHLYCFYGIDENGNVLREKEDSVFYAASYDLEVVDVETSYEDLVNKLTSLYGEGSLQTSGGTVYYGSSTGSGTYEYEERIMTWLGDNDTGVRIYCIVNDLEHSQGDPGSITIYYAKTDAWIELDKLQNALHQEAIANESANRDASDTSGL